ncbi:MAG TPA: hypothetical protein VLZ12_02695 [Verrucomicrobiae bacterium]|nr:hypothetical protein [Verrucomicrobiae bacterium]
MTSRKTKQQSDFTGSRVLILTGRYAGREGVCSGKSADGERWAISPDGSDEILRLVFEKEFGLLVDLSANPEDN